MAAWVGWGMGGGGGGYISKWGPKIMSSFPLTLLFSCNELQVVLP